MGTIECIANQRDVFDWNARMRRLILAFAGCGIRDVFFRCATYYDLDLCSSYEHLHDTFHLSGFTELVKNKLFYMGFISMAFTLKT